MKGYVFFFQKILDAERLKEYQAVVIPLIQKYEGKFVAKTAMKDAPYCENDEEFTTAVVIEFPSEKRALEWYKSEEYQKAIALRVGASIESLAITPSVAPDGIGDFSAVVTLMINVDDPETMKAYNPGPSLSTYQGKMVVRSSSPTVSEEFEGKYSRAVILAFPTLELAMAWIRSDEYKDMNEIRHSASSGPFVIMPCL